MASQAATYARAIFCQRPMRVFALVLAFNNDSKELSFLIFIVAALQLPDRRISPRRTGGAPIPHVGTMAYSDRCRNHRLLQRHHISAPCGPGGKSYVRAAVDTILFKTLCIRSRMTHVFLLLLLEPATEDQLPGGTKIGSGSMTRTSKKNPSLSKGARRTEGGHSTAGDLGAC